MSSTNRREIDRLVAETVMGWDSSYLGHHSDANNQQFGKVTWCPSEDITAAWAVLVHLAAKMNDGSLLEVSVSRSESPTTTGWRCSVSNLEECYEAQAATAPLAICLAALKSVGVEAP